jgi:putative peptide zinc metalloprotease protein
LKPRLRGHANVHRHEYRGELWYVLQDRAKGRFYRFHPETFELIGRMNGKRTVQELWVQAAERLGDDAPTQNEVVQLLAQLHSTDMLLCDVPPDTAELLRRSRKIERQSLMMRFRSPLALRFPLIDPDRFLTRTQALVRPLFGIGGALLWLAVVVTAAVQAGLHWPELTENVVDRVFSIDNGLLMLAAYPVVKALHELGHGYAVKVWGGECHEMGIIFLVFMPIPYVDASAASEFRSKRRRVIVGSAGIFVELFLASLALFFWINAEPGILRSLAYNVVLIGGVSTLLFNGNPLLRYDGYYILADLIDIPNLGQRGQQYFKYLVQRYAFGSEQAVAPYAGPGERFWFVAYTVVASLYRVFVYTAIILFLASKFFGLGMLIAAWVAAMWVLVPLYKGVKFLVSSPTLLDRRLRAVLTSAAAVALVGLLLFAMPFPSRTRAEGVVWVPEESIVRAGTDGFVRRLVAEPDAMVTEGQPVIECSDPLITATVAVLQARVEELAARHAAAMATDLVQSQIIRVELEDARAELERELERRGELEIRSPATGRLVLPNAVDLPDRFVRQGETIGFVLDARKPTIRVVVPQSDIDLVRQRTQHVEVRMTDNLDRILPAAVRREVPEGEQRLPSTTLGSIGGGTIAIDPSEQSGTKTFERVFQFDVEVAQPLDDVFVGARAYVRFDHGYEPIGLQAYRRIRQVFLKRFNI